MTAALRTSLVVGASGLVGGTLMRALGGDVVGTYRTRPSDALRQLDACDPRAVGAILENVRPATLYFPAAEPSVDWCEEHPDASNERNVVPALVTLEACHRVGTRFVFFSTDYVFDGRAGPYAEDERTAPLQVYGRHKLEIEDHVLAAGGTVVRTTTVYGEEQPPGKNFVLRLIARLGAGERVQVPVDQISTPTWADDLAAGAVAVADRGGIWHVAGPEMVSRDAFARMVARAFGLDGTLIDAVPTGALAQRAARPLRGGLRTDKLTHAVGHRPLAPLDALAVLRERLERSPDRARRPT